MSGQVYQVCDLVDYNTSTGVCTQPYYTTITTGLLPPLSVADALTIGSAIVGCWALGFGFRIIRKFLFKG